MNNLPLKTRTYLQRYELNAWNLKWNKNNRINIAVIIPALAEYENIPFLLKSLSLNDTEILKETLLVFVINNLAGSPHEIKKDNLRTIKFLEQIINKDNNCMNSYSSLNIGLIDAATAGNELPEKHGGVGLARKIGMDTALKIFDYKADKKNIIISLDADCTVDTNYLAAIKNKFASSDCDAATLEYEHNFDNNPNFAEAIIYYEFFLRYYVLGLNYANSNYAFHTIGSAMAFTDEAYIKAGGMNKRTAGEDFYFLQKLAKLYPICKINETKVYPAVRRSLRVPFGTGRRIDQFENRSGNSVLVYNPAVFKILKFWLKLLYSEQALDVQLLLNESKSVHPELHNFLVKNNFYKDWQNILNNFKSDGQLNYQRSNWFDGFKTLKLIHHLRDTSCPNINMLQAADELLNMLNVSRNNIIKNSALETKNNYLLKFRELERNT